MHVCGIIMCSNMELLHISRNCYLLLSIVHFSYTCGYNGGCTGFSDSTLSYNHNHNHE